MASSSYIHDYFNSKYLKYSGYKTFNIPINDSYNLTLYFNYGHDTDYHYETRNKDVGYIYESTAEHPINLWFSFIRANFKLKNPDLDLYMLGSAIDLNLLDDSHFFIGSGSGNTKNENVFLSPSKSAVLVKYLGAPYSIKQTGDNTIRYGNFEAGVVFISMLKYTSDKGFCFEWVDFVGCHTYSMDAPFENDYGAYYVMSTKHIFFMFTPSSLCCLAECFGITE